MDIFFFYKIYILKPSKAVALHSGVPRLGDIGRETFQDFLLNSSLIDSSKSHTDRCSHYVMYCFNYPIKTIPGCREPLITQWVHLLTVTGGQPTPTHQTGHTPPGGVSTLRGVTSMLALWSCKHDGT